MIIYIYRNGQPIPLEIGPSAISWEMPDVKGFDGLGAPVYMPFWSCRLSFTELTVVRYNDWLALCDGQRHDIRLPHPTTDEMTIFTDVYVVTVAPRLATHDICRAAASGVDIQLNRIAVSGAP